MFKQTVLLALLVLGSTSLAMADSAPAAAPEPAASDLAWLTGGESAAVPAVGVCPKPEFKAPVLVPIPRDCVSCRICTSDTDCGGTSLGICATGPSYWTCGQPRGCICR